MKEYLNDFTRFEFIQNHYLAPFALKVIGAFALWIVSGFVIRLTKRLLRKALEVRKVDPTLIIYASQTLGVALRALTVVAILNLFGIETTSFSAILAAAGVAIGVAWSGLLSNFAAGIFLILFRPFKSGDSITAGGVTGVVREIGLFATTIDNGDNLRVFVGNNKLFSDNILNYSSNAYRIASFKILLAHSVSPEASINAFTLALEKVPGVRPDPKVSGEITEFSPMGVFITMKASCHQSAYANVLVAGNQAIYEVMKQEKYPIPEMRTVLINP